MRNIVSFNKEWQFSKNHKEHWDNIELPHTWNSSDGTDGGNDYYRGKCRYIKNFAAPEMASDDEVWIEFQGAAMKAEVYLNETFLGTHSGGYSTFRFKITDLIQEQNFLVVDVDNGFTRDVYPQKADFTFYGGLYRDVNLILVPKSHFDLGYYGSKGLKVTPQVQGSDAMILVEAWIRGEAEEVEFSIENETKRIYVNDGYAKCEFIIKNVHLWDGVEDPYLYTVNAKLDSGDSVQEKFGCRSFKIDPKEGFFLNGRSYPLIGAARHQDREGFGSAINKEHHEEDMKILLEMGANSVRLAHYQHDQYFYNLCDEYGLIVWAEIPYITEHMPEANENAYSQMKELVIQNYNHPSIICWGLSNEITAAGKISEDLMESHKVLNNLCHSIDHTRPTTMAHAFMLESSHPLVQIPDISSYNLYYGWYLGELEDNNEWFDQYHQNYPDRVIGLSEYGADANPMYQSDSPEKGDWTESYQALYHEHMLKMWTERPYIWAMHVWNMFDFGADGRDEGGKPGQNQKGLVTFDRRTKKDAFYIYKAYLSKDPFVHICGKRYVDRVGAKTEVKVYSNKKSVTLFVDDELFEHKCSDKVFVFTLPLYGTHKIVAKSDTLEDEIVIRKVQERNPAYIASGGEVINWFDKPEEIQREGFLSVLDSMEEIKKSEQGRALLESIMQKARESYGDVAKGVEMPENIQKMMDKTPLQKILKQAGKAITNELVNEINSSLNQIPKVQS